MNKIDQTDKKVALPRQIFQPIHSDLLDSLSSQADNMTANQDRPAWKLSNAPGRLSVIARTTATLFRTQQTQIPLSSFVQRLQRTR
jgi:hypothetical protein